jgi:glutathione S-transferase
MPLALPAFMTLLAVLWYFVTISHVAIMHGKTKIHAPAMTGDPALERSVRVQTNTLEQLVAFLPAMWIYARFGNPRWAAIACAVWIVGRIIYAIGYWQDAKGRTPGFAITAFALIAVWIAAMVSVVKALMIE